MNTQCRIASTFVPHSIVVSTFSLMLLDLFAAPAFAQTPAPAPAPSQRYQVERANCFNGRSNEDAATCMKEANAALAQDKKGKLAAPGTPYRANATERCQALPAADKADCERRMRGDGTVSGTANSGGIIRELVVQTPVAPK